MPEAAELTDQLPLVESVPQEPEEGMAELNIEQLYIEEDQAGNVVSSETISEDIVFRTEGRDVQASVEQRPVEDELQEELDMAEEREQPVAWDSEMPDDQGLVMNEMRGRVEAAELDSSDEGPVESGAVQVGAVAADRLRTSRDERLRNEVREFKRETETDQRKQDKKIHQQEEQIKHLNKKTEKLIDVQPTKLNNNEPQKPRPKSVDGQREQSISEVKKEELSPEQPVERTEKKPTPSEQYSRAAEQELRPQSSSVSTREEGSPSYQGIEREFSLNTNPEKPKIPDEHTPIDRVITDYERTMGSLLERVAKADQNENYNEAVHEQRNEIKDNPARRDRRGAGLADERIDVSDDSLSSSGAAPVHKVSQGGKHATSDNSDDRLNTKKDLYKTAVISGVVTAVVLLAAVAVITLLS